MKCPKCGSENVNVQAVSIVKNKKHGIFYWLFGGFIIEVMLWMFLTLPMLIIKIFRPKGIKTSIKTLAICQTCGNQWRA